MAGEKRDPAWCQKCGKPRKVYDRDYTLRGKLSCLELKDKQERKMAAEPLVQMSVSEMRDSCVEAAEVFQHCFFGSRTLTLCAPE